MKCILKKCCTWFDNSPYNGLLNKQRACHPNAHPNPLPQHALERPAGEGVNGSLHTHRALRCMYSHPPKVSDKTRR